MKLANLFFAVPMVALLLSPTGCTVTTTPRPVTEVAYVDAQPPPPPAAEVEVIPVAPGPGYVWVPGYHRWDGRAYEWIRGHYDRRPERNAHYVHGHWEHRGRANVWVDGHWT